MARRRPVPAQAAARIQSAPRQVQTRSQTTRGAEERQRRHPHRALVDPAEPGEGDRDRQVAGPPLVFPGEPERVQPVPAEREVAGDPDHHRRRERPEHEPPRSAPCHPPPRRVDGPKTPTSAEFSARQHRVAGGGERGRRGRRRGRGLDRGARDEGGAGGGLAADDQGGDAEHREEHREAVVVGAADHVDEDQRVEGDEGGGAARVDAAPGGQAGDDPGEAEDRDRRDRLQHRDREPDRQPGEGIGREGEEGAVGARRFGPGDVGEGGVGGRRVGRVDVGVEAVAHAEPGVVEVAEGVVGEQDRGAGEGEDGDDDQRADDARRRAAAPPRARRGRRGTPPRSGRRQAPRRCAATCAADGPQSADPIARRTGASHRVDGPKTPSC